MREDYLWDPRSEPADPFVVELEQALASKRHRAQPLPATDDWALEPDEDAVILAGPGARWRAAAAGALLALAAGAVLWFALATAPTGSTTRVPQDGMMAGTEPPAVAPASNDGLDDKSVIRQSGDEAVVK